MPSSSERPSSWVRDHLANERTLLAWVRTALAFMAFGLGIAKLSLLISMLGVEHASLADGLPDASISAVVGALMIASGGAIAAVGVAQTWHWSAEVDGPAPRRGPLLLTAGLAVVTAVGLTIYVLL
ncbi:MAG: DUF202 domain-containing protein [Myxococcota bacterium]